MLTSNTIYIALIPLFRIIAFGNFSLGSYSSRCSLMAIDPCSMDRKKCKWTSGAPPNARLVRTVWLRRIISKGTIYRWILGTLSNQGHLRLVSVRGPPSCPLFHLCLAPCISTNCLADPPCVPSPLQMSLSVHHTQATITHLHPLCQVLSSCVPDLTAWSGPFCCCFFVIRPFIYF